MSRRSFSPEYRDTLKVLEQILEPATYGNEKLRYREMAILKRLRTTMPDMAFWLTVKPVIPLDSLLYLYGPGAQALADEWREYQLQKAIGDAEKEHELNRDIERLERSVNQTL